VVLSSSPEPAAVPSPPHRQVIQHLPPSLHERDTTVVIEVAEAGDLGLSLVSNLHLKEQAAASPSATATATSESVVACAQGTLVKDYKKKKFTQVEEGNTASTWE
jgi:hypothetical protein